MPSLANRPYGWWKPTTDTLAAYLRREDKRRLFAGAAALAPPEWQLRAKKTLGERLGILLAGTVRAGVSIGTLGLSEIMYRLSKPGLLTGNEDLPALDLVVGPTDAAILITDGAVNSVLTAERLATHTEWERLDKLFGRGPHLEVVMLDRAPVPLNIPLRVVLGGEEVPVQVDADVAFGLEGADRALNLLARAAQGVVKGAALNEPEEGDGSRASFVTAVALADRLQRRLEHGVARMQFVQGGVAALQANPDLLGAAELELTDFLAEELGVFGFVVERCQLLLGRTEDQQIAIDRRRGELEQQRNEMLDAARGIEEQRQAVLDAERRDIERERRESELNIEGELGQIAQTNRFALARMVSLNDQELARLEREGFAKQREDERAEELLDFRQQQLLLREERTRVLEEDLTRAQSKLDTERIGMQIEREKLEIAALAQDQNLARLRQLKEIEREDDLLRERSRAAAETKRLAAAKDLTPEQMMATLADRDPEIARALGARFGSEAEFARKSAEDQKELMREMQAQMARLMEKGLEANAAVASGLVGTSRPPSDGVPAATNKPAAGSPGSRAAPCGKCGEAVEPDWNVCPFCGEQQARA